MDADPRMTVYEEIMSGCKQEAARNKLRSRSGEIIRTAMVLPGGSAAVVIFENKYGVDRDKGVRIVSLTPLGDGWLFASECFAPREVLDKNQPQEQAIKLLPRVAAEAIDGKFKHYTYEIWHDRRVIATSPNETFAILTAQAWGYSCIQVRAYHRVMMVDNGRVKIGRAHV